eukprot:Hpha_TRINITY_DN20485_c0_g1::TRINITY_DN20485_c0_g1_i1::g.64241::m.64241
MTTSPRRPPPSMTTSPRRLAPSPTGQARQKSPPVPIPSRASLLYTAAETAEMEEDGTPQPETLMQCWLSVQDAGGLLWRLGRGLVTELEIRDVRARPRTWLDVCRRIAESPGLRRVTLSHVCIPGGGLARLGDWADPDYSGGEPRELVLGTGVVAAPPCTSDPAKAARCFELELEWLQEENWPSERVLRAPLSQRWELAAEELRSVRDRVLRLAHPDWNFTSPSQELGPSGLALYTCAAADGMTPSDREQCSTWFRSRIKVLVGPDTAPRLRKRQQLDTLAAGVERLLRLKSAAIIDEEDALRKAFEDGGEARAEERARRTARALDDGVAQAAGLPAPCPSAAWLELMSALAADARDLSHGDADVALYRISTALDCALRPLLRRLGRSHEPREAPKREASPPRARPNNRARPP